MRKLKNASLRILKLLSSLRWSHKLKPRYLHENVPYFSQWESRELVEKIITQQMGAADDPLWRKSGAVNKKEYEVWSASGCGMACLKMILVDTRHEPVPLVELGKRCLAYGGYRLPLEDSPGLFYKPFVNFIQAEYGLTGKAVSALTMPEIKRALGNGGYVIASVTPEIRFPTKTPSRRGGHLVLLLGYDDERKEFMLHNPSGFADTQEGVVVTYSNFSKFFDRKGIIVFRTLSIGHKY